jgi:hypothetical protein
MLSYILTLVMCWEISERFLGSKKLCLQFLKALLDSVILVVHLEYHN